MSYPFKFDRQTTIEAILFITLRVKDRTLHNVFKVLYFADRQHLERYGRLISGDRYIAMDYGPVPSHTYDLIKVERGDRIGVPDAYVKSAFEVVEKITLKPKRTHNRDMFSESDIESLEWAIDRYGSNDFSERVRVSHDESYRDTKRNQPIDVEALTRGMEDRDLLLQYVTEQMA